MNSFGGESGQMDELEIVSRVRDDILKTRSGYICGLENGPKLVERQMLSLRMNLHLQNMS